MGLIAPVVTNHSLKFPYIAWESNLLSSSLNANVFILVCNSEKYLYRWNTAF